MEKREWARPWMAFGLLLGSCVYGCNGKPELAAYFHRAEVAPEPAASALVVAPVSSPAVVTTSAGGASGLVPPAGSVAGAMVPAVPTNPSLNSGRAAVGMHPIEGTLGTSPGARQQVEPTPSSTRPTASIAAVPAAPSAQQNVPPEVPAPTAVAVTSPPKGGKRNASVGGTAVSGGNVSNAARVIAGLRSGLRECYQREQSDVEGAIRFRLTVGAGGAVTAVNAQPSGGATGGLVQCTTARVRAAKFDAPEGGSATIAFPVTFVVERAL